MKELTVGGMALSLSVIDTVVSLAMNDIKGVAAVGSTPVNSLVAALSGKGNTGGIDADVDEDGKLVVGVHISVEYGVSLPEVAAAIRTAIYDALTTQIGVGVSRIDVFVDGIEFKD